ncbi:MAG: sugar transferase [Bacteroidia bacterium]|nr:sugar transferase [Bacteroidia bacterium]
MKPLFDFTLSLLLVLLLAPLLLLLSLWVRLDSEGPVFYLQERVGWQGTTFRIFKFRTMHSDADKKGLLTVGGRDPRITRAGYYLRRYKLDELPQLFNVLRGEMSLVGPRPEVMKYVSLYTPEQRKVLNIKPGITDYASIAFANENELLGKSADPETTYVNEIMPTKLQLNLKYMQEQNFFTDIKILFRTVVRIIS